MRLRLALLALGLVTAGCGPRRVRWQPPPGAAAATSVAYGVVWAGATFHVAPDPRAPTVSLAPPGGARTPWVRDTFVSFRVVGERRGWAAVETLGDGPGPHCAPERPALHGLQLRLYVPSRALAPVTVREVDQEFADGTSVHLSRGVPLEDLRRQQLFRARIGELSTVVRLDPAAVGTRYLPSSPTAPGGAVGGLSADALRAGVPILGQTGRVHASEAPDPRIYAVEPRGSESLVELRPRCGRLTVRVPVHVIADQPGAAGVEAPASEPSTPRRPWVDAGATVFWPGGREAGRITQPTALRDEVDGDGERRCFARAMHERAEPSVVLCYARAEIVDTQAAAGRLAPPGE